MKITIYDVAKKAGVSISTTSKALNDRKDVGDLTKIRIREIAQELNYEPSHFARALAMRKTGNIGVMTVRYYQTPMLTNPFYSRIIEGIEERLISSDLNLVTNVLRREQVEAGELPKMVKEKSVDGIIMLGHMPPDFAAMVAEKAGPAVVVDNMVKGGQISSVTMDNSGGAYKATSYLLETGHKKVAYVSGPSRRYSFKQRYEGYVRAHREKGLTPDPALAVFNEKEEEGFEWTGKILDGPARPDGIFACNDVTAILTINMLKGKGIEVPEDISIIGFDNIELSEHFIPSISTIDINKEAMGIKAAEILMDIISTKKNRVENIVFPTQLKIRSSFMKRI
ncbi:MAG: LacI family transcriptional regulator [Spirochaetia bacterium]|nr:LacI family transcriptional regulator [Spirochaetia bacterium]